MAQTNDLRSEEVSKLLEVFSKMDDENEIFAFLEDSFTVREIKEISQRLSVAQMLDSGKSYYEIEQATGASATTIARVSKCLTYGSGGYAKALEILNNGDK